ncbi:programmed cell death protein 2 [Helicostylum pulchrum]|uniref:Programmed cell death protein 2 C-terminal domain-containing protein n=1 Tax=Helicostylum pulchrum TaxID=562976 RepID=A0ABP9XM43_9FUNG|nr:programmed cell death protein 2 [Helicostylum pulchrum]
MSNKKQIKKEAPVLLGIPDGEIELDNDAYITKLGGLPVWLDPKTPPSSKVCQCRVCGDSMYLIFQSYVPLPDSPYHRVLYVWGCNKRSCMRKEGSFSVVRSQVVDQTYLKAQRQKEEEKRKKEEKKKAAVAAANNQKFQLGDLWGNSAGSFGNANNTGGGFGMKPTTTTGFGMKPATTGFGMKPATTTGFGMKPTAASIVGKKKEDNTLIDKMQQLNIVSDPIIDTTQLPQFPGQYLYIDEERTDNYDNMGIDMSRYKEYLDMEKELLMEVDEGGETWQGETYEKQHLPRGVDKQFKKFTERVECSPSQCVRYGFSGQPLFYSSLSQQQQQLIASHCKHCNGPRVFEFQLMPNILSILPTTEYATREQNVENLSGKAKNIDTKAVLDSWNVGMEFGTILVFVCQKDCHPGNLEDVAYVEEAIVVQYETE